MMLETVNSPVNSVAFSQTMTEKKQVAWLIHLFNNTFKHKNTLLVHSQGEPEYFPAVYDNNQCITPARIAFAHGFFASALHEISHWCIAGKHRRTLADFGYWYAPDGRNAEQQKQFETVEVKPQAIEWLFTQACFRRFRVSVDNLDGEPTDASHFKQAVFNQVQQYLHNKEKLPTDAQHLLNVLCQQVRPHQPIQATEFRLEEL